MTPAEEIAKNKRRKPYRCARRTQVKAVWDCRLRELREALRISVRDVAAAVGLTAPCVWGVEAGRDPQLTTARKLAAFYGKTVEELWVPLPDAKAPEPATMQEPPRAATEGA